MLFLPPPIFHQDDWKKARILSPLHLSLGKGLKQVSCAVLFFPSIFCITEACNVRLYTWQDPSCLTSILRGKELPLVFLKRTKRGRKKLLGAFLREPGAITLVSRIVGAQWKCGKTLASKCVCIDLRLKFMHQYRYYLYHWLPWGLLAKWEDSET